MPETSLIQEYATTIALKIGQKDQLAGNSISNWAGLMLRGPSASGKSDLALRLMDQGAELVADDRTCLENRDGMLFASPPEPIAGKLEVRGLGIVNVAYQESCPLALVADLKPLDQIERLPEQKTVTYLGYEIPLIQLCAFEVSAVMKLKLAVQALWEKNLLEKN